MFKPYKSLPPLVLPEELENRRDEFLRYIHSARENIRNFASGYCWDNLVEEEFFDQVMIFDDKKKYNTALLKLVEADCNLDLPETYCAALEKRILMVVTPEYYARVYPDGIEEKSYEKLLTHEIAHRLHIRILNGDEEAMGPIWFFEGFAIFAADQFSQSKLILSKDEMTDLMRDPQRGSYVKYNYIFRYFVSKIPLPDLVFKAKQDNFSEYLIRLLES